MLEWDKIDPRIMEVVRISSITGFLAAVTILINVNFKVYKRIFKDRAKSYWWLFLLSSVVILALFLYIFSLLFGKL